MIVLLLDLRMGNGFCFRAGVLVFAECTCFCFFWLSRKEWFVGDGVCFSYMSIVGVTKHVTGFCVFEDCIFFDEAP